MRGCASTGTLALYACTLGPLTGEVSVRFQSSGTRKQTGIVEHDRIPQAITSYLQQLLWSAVHEVRAPLKKQGSLAGDIRVFPADFRGLAHVEFKARVCTCTPGRDVVSRCIEPSNDMVLCRVAPLGPYEKGFCGSLETVPPRKLRRHACVPSCSRVGLKLNPYVHSLMYEAHHSDHNHSSKRLRAAQLNVRRCRYTSRKSRGRRSQSYRHFHSQCFP